jgi:hypothetical protein
MAGGEEEAGGDDDTIAPALYPFRFSSMGANTEDHEA